MKRLMVALLATTSMALAAPAFAHPEDHAAPPVEQWNNGAASYGDFNQEYQHIWDGIQHGLSDGSYTRDQAQRYFGAMQRIRARADALQQQGRWDPRETQAQLEQLHNSLHSAHEVGHSVQDDHHTNEAWNNGGASYADFNQEYQHIWQGIQHGLSDGAYTRRQAQGFNRAMQQIKARADWSQRNGRYDPQDTQARLERLHETMHVAHERGHDRQDRHNGNDFNNRR